MTALFAIGRGDLAPVLDRANRIVERRNTIPILSHMRLVAGAGALTVTATDLDIELQTTTKLVFGPKTGEIAVALPAGLLRDFVKKLPEGAEIGFGDKPDGSQMSVASGRSRATMFSLPASDFPAMVEGGFSHRFEIGAGELLALLDSCRFAISTEETRYYLNGIYLHVIEADGVAWLRAVATDGHRLARRQMPAPIGAAGMPGIIVPKKTVAELAGLLAEAGDKARADVEVSETKFRVTLDGTVLTSKLIDGTFPDYARVIPTGNANVFRLKRAAFRAALDRVITISADRARAVKITFGADEATLECVNPDSGSAADAVSVEKADGEPVSIGFNGRYALEVADQVEGDEIVFHLGDGGAPALVTGTADDPLFVIMPMRI